MATPTPAADPDVIRALAAYVDAGTLAAALVERLRADGRTEAAAVIALMAGEIAAPPPPPT